MADPTPTARKSGFRLRKLWLDVHLWIGAGLFVLLIPLSLTGSALVWRDGLDRIFHANRYHTTEAQAGLAPSAYLAAAQAALPHDMRPARISYPDRLGDPVVVQGRGRGEPGKRPPSANVWLDPADARVLDAGPGMDGAVRFMHDLHGQLFLRQTGRKIVGWLGWAMLVNCLTGIWLWWPRRGPVWRGLRWSRSTSFNINLHHLVGFWIMIPLAVLSLTGAWIAFPQFFAAVTGPFTGAHPQAEGAGGNRPPGPPPGAPEARGRPRLSPDQVAATALTQAAGSQIASLAMPSGGREPVWQVELRPSASQPRQTLRISDRTGLIQTGPARPAGGGPLARLVRRIHDGDDTGWFWRAIITVAGIAPAVLGVTGVIMWLRRRRVKMAAQASIGVQTTSGRSAD